MGGFHKVRPHFFPVFRPPMYVCPQCVRNGLYQPPMSVHSPTEVNYDNELNGTEILTYGVPTNIYKSANIKKI